MKAFRWIAILPAALMLVATASGSASARERETVNYNYDTSNHPRLSLKNINGDLTVDGWDKNRIEVTALKTASSTERLADIEIHAEMENDHLRIEVEFKTRNNWSSHGESMGVDFTVHVPRGSEIDAVEMVNGNVDLTHIDGDIEVSSVNGDVSGDKLGGNVEMATVNGEASLIANGGVDSISMHSVNGGVLLVLPRKFDARISAGTVHGSIRAVDGMGVDATSFTGSSMHGTVGKGGMQVDLNTVNGSIEIRREGESGLREKE